MQIIPEVKKNFCTGSSFHGKWTLDMTGFGVYTYPDGTEYHGTFEQGLFHGNGTIITPSKFQLYGLFDMGKLVHTEQLKFADNLPYSTKKWKYLQGCDRRYAREIENGISPVGDSYEIHTKPTRDIPENYYDCTNSFFLPEGNAICHDDTLLTKKIVSPCESRFIQKFYRNTKKDAIGYNADIMEADLVAIKLIDCVLQTDYNICKCSLTDAELYNWERNRINYLETKSDLQLNNCQCSDDEDEHTPTASQ